jgi:hypothetical protein
VTAPRATVLMLLAACSNPGIDLDASYACSSDDQCGSPDYECCLAICRRIGTFDEHICIVDAGTPDAGKPDAGTADSGTPDAGPNDSGTPDSGSQDAGDGGP